MTTGNKLAALRRQNNYTQEQFAELIGVSRQAVSKWENDLAYPETEKLLQISRLYGCSMDYLLNDEVNLQETTASSRDSTKQHSEPSPQVLMSFTGFHIRERKSKKMLWGVPLWHIGKNARGIIAIGLTARGIVSVGFFSMGVVSVGMLSLGVIALGLLAVGAFSAGCISAGVISAGAIALGVVSFGAVAGGDFSFGALAVGKYFAKGDDAQAMIALGKTKAEGDVFRRIGHLTEDEKISAAQALDAVVPAHLGWAKLIVRAILIK